ncbi:Hfq-related RNA-binding protein [Leptothoe spongobia]|uniref:RNA-binding protein hfq n=1 Tax=Leptothoe spongobia TAU-MAC 1115 TaxID=1967444 RepID=A0A947GJF6_9CYAN|nr:RNA-binding protein hfq [Leptothoe spongobia]MBT9316960.1 RNA-binding protein hfq [Leptothoe spongobia TAU-MAC 1115]
MATEFDTGLPSIRQVQTFIRDQNTVEIKLLTGDVFTGIVVWQDIHAICLSIEGETLLAMRAALAYIKIAN